MSAECVLETRGLEKRFGGVVAISSVVVRGPVAVGATWLLLLTKFHPLTSSTHPFPSFSTSPEFRLTRKRICALRNPTLPRSKPRPMAVA